MRVNYSQLSGLFSICLVFVLPTEVCIINSETIHLGTLYGRALCFLELSEVHLMLRTKSFARSSRQVWNIEVRDFYDNNERR